MTNLKQLAEILDTAAASAKGTAQLSATETLSVDEAYRIQSLSVARRISRGEKRIGMKLGFTSRAKMIQMGVDDLIWGRLTDHMLIEDGGTISMASYVHPRAEPEIAFLLSKRLGANPSIPEALAAVEAVAPAMEIIDSRYENFRFDLCDVVADNTSASGLVLGPWVGPPPDISNLGTILAVDGVPREVGSTAAILGHPARALVAGARLSAAAGEPLEAGWIIMAGAATAAVALEAGNYVRTEVEGLGSVALKVES